MRLQALLKQKRLAQLLAVSFFSTTAAYAVDVIKGNNPDTLDQTTSWVGGVVPTAADVAVWDNTVLGANSTLLNSNLSWQGIRIADPGGLVTIGAGNTLTLGTGGIVMSAATQDLVLQNGITLGANQNWNVNTGRTLTASGVIDGTSQLTKQGAGTLVLSGSNTFTGPLVLNAGVTIVNSDSSFGAVPGMATTNLTFSGNATLQTDASIALAATRTVTFDSNVAATINTNGNNLTIPGVMSNTGTANTTATLTKIGGGVLELSGTGSFVANTILRFGGAGNANSGSIRITSSNALGTNPIFLDSRVTNNSSTAGRSAFELAGNVVVPSNVTLRASGRTVDANGAFLRNVSGDNEFAGTISIFATGGGYPIHLEGGTLTLSGSLTNNVTASTRSVAFFGAGNAILSGSIFDTGTGLVALQHSGTGLITVTTNKTYTGFTEISGNGGRLSISAFGNGAAASFLGASTSAAANLRISGNGTLLYTGGTATTDRNIQFTSGNGNINVADANATLTVNSGTGAGILRKTGPGTLRVAQGTSNYTGGTAVAEGKLESIMDNNFPTTAPLIIGTGAGGTTVGTFDLVDYNQTVSAMTVASNSASQNIVNIPAGRTLTVNGPYTQGIGAVGQTTNLTMTGTGSFVVNNSASIFQVGVDNTNQNGTTSNASLNLLALSSFSANVLEFRAGYNSRNGALVTLSNTSSSITADAIHIGNSLGNNGTLAQVILGEGTNTINSDLITIGAGKADAILRFAATAPNTGTVVIAGKSNAGANFTIGSNNGTGTSATPTGTLDLRGHAATVTANLVRLGVVDQTATGTYNGVLRFDTGTFTANALEVGFKSNTGSGTATGNLFLSGGTFTVNNQFTLGSQTGSGTSNATLEITGGTFTSNASILRAAGTGTSTVTLNGGTLNLVGNTVGDAIPVANFNLQSGTLANLGNYNAGANLTKTTGGTLVIAGTNNFPGSLNVNAGTVRVNGTTLNSAGASVAANATLGGSGTVGGLTTVAALGLIAPGNSAGELTFSGGMDLSAGGIYNWELAALDTIGPGANYDSIVISGGNLALGGASELTLNFGLIGMNDPDSGNLFWNSNHTWKIIDVTGGTNTGDTNFASITNPNWTGGVFSTFVGAGANQGDVFLQFTTAIPEPSTMVLGAIGLLVMAGYGIRRRKEIPGTTA